MLLRSKLVPRLEPKDFNSVEKDVGHFAVVKLNSKGRAKFAGAEQVAVATKSLRSYSVEKQAAMVKDLLRELKENSKKKRNEQILLLMFAESSILARNQIKKLISGTN